MEKTKEINLRLSIARVWSEHLNFVRDYVVATFLEKTGTAIYGHVQYNSIKNEKDLDNSAMGEGDCTDNICFHLLAGAGKGNSLGFEIGLNYTYGPNYMQIGLMNNEDDYNYWFEGEPNDLKNEKVINDLYLWIKDLTPPVYLIQNLKKG